MRRHGSRISGSGRRLVVVLDTNVVVPGLIGFHLIPPKDAVSTACIQAARSGRIQLAFSALLLEEVLDVLQREPFALSRGIARRNVAVLEKGARIVSIPGRLTALTRDPDDNMVLETAIEGRADILVTWNLAHFEEVGRDTQGHLQYRGIEIVRPPDLLRTLRHQSG